MNLNPSHYQFPKNAFFNQSKKSMGNLFSAGSSHQKPLTKEHKILLLGSGESGKSTIATQLRTIFDSNLPQLDFYRNFIFVNMIELTICALKRYYARGNPQFAIDGNSIRADNFMKTFQKISDLGDFQENSFYNDEVHENLILLWKDPKFKEMLNYKGMHH